MNRFVLDTDVLTLYQHGDPAVVRHVQSHPLAELAVTIISVEEQLGGWYAKVRRAKKREQLVRAYHRMTEAVRFLVRFEILSFTDPAMVRYEQLRKVHRHVAKNDLRIAAIALEGCDTVATRNVRDFQQVPGLSIADWSA